MIKTLFQTTYLVVKSYWRLYRRGERPAAFWCTWFGDEGARKLFSLSKATGVNPNVLLQMFVQSGITAMEETINQLVQSAASANENTPID